jgi:cytosine/adenosine deaminase-related metal-dependent hydrolase
LPHTPLHQPGSHLIYAEAAADGQGTDLLGGVAAWLDLLDDGTIRLIDIGPARTVTARAPSGATVHRRPGCVLIPGLVNAHTHLDLTHIGPQPLDADGAPGSGFSGWIDMIRTRRVVDQAAIDASVRRGVDLARQGGTVLLGDIAGAVAGRPSPLATIALGRECAETGLQAVSFIEFFAQGQHWPERMRAAWQAHQDASQRTSTANLRIGLQPHAPYSVHAEAYAEAARAASARGVPLCTHLAESPAEVEFIAHATGPFRALLQAVNAWDETTARAIGHGRSPVEHVLSAVAPMHGPGVGMGLVHLNTVHRADLAALATRQDLHPIYCPRASAYFGFDHPAAFGPHQYRGMGRVALGTDSVVNLPPGQVARRGICVLDEASLLVGRDGLKATVALAMATAHGEAFLLGRPARQSRLAAGANLLGIVAVPMTVQTTTAADAALASDAPVELLAQGRAEAVHPRRT